MGKKNKQKKEIAEASDGKQPQQQQQQQQQGGRAPQQQQRQEGGQAQQQQQPTGGGQQQGGGQQRQQAQGGGGQQRQQPQEGSWREQQRPGGGQQRQQPEEGAWGGQQQTGGARQQQGGGQQRQQAQGGGGQQRQQPQEGTWGGQQQTGGARQQQGGGQQRQQQPRQQQQQQPRQQQQQQQPRQQQQQQQQQQPQPRQQQQQQFPPSQSQSSTPSHSSSTTSLTSVASANGIKRGTIGIPGTVETNYLTMNLDKMPSVAYHYDVTITPDRPKKYQRPAFDQFNRLPELKDYEMAYDGKKSFYTIRKLPFSSFEAEFEMPDTGSRTIKFKVSIKETDSLEIDLNSLRNYFKERVFDKPMRALQCIEVVLANPCHKTGVRVGRSFFTRPNQFYDLSDGYEMWTGIYQAAILGKQPYLNVDISHKSFPSECLITDYIQRNYRNVDLQRELDRRNISALRDYLKMVNIIYEPPKSFAAIPKTYKVNGVSDVSAAQLKFKLDDGRETTVAQYYQSKGYSLRYPNLNCLHVGSTVRNIYVPLELCRIPAGQALNKKDGPRQVQNMIRFAATSTDERKRKIMAMLQHFRHNADPKIQRFGIQIGANFIVVPMRLLKSPMLEYFGNNTLVPSNGSWRMSDSNQFLQTQKLNTGHKWALIYSRRGSCNSNTLFSLAQLLSKEAAKRKMDLASKPEVQPYDDVYKTLKQLKDQNYNLVIVIIPNYGTTYAEIKQSAELRCGLLTQCIKEFTVQKRGNDMQTILNLLLKINAKLNGTNHKISPRTHVNINKVMFLGADVTHPSPDQREIPSVVGVAASHDLNGACYNMQYRLQRSTVENIEDMESIFTHHLNVYFRYQNFYPEHIIYYRDGVSDGQFPIVKANELRAIRAACKKLRIQPKLTCIIVVKRHHTRFFPQTGGCGKFNNVAPGTVVDQDIVHPNEVQFFMVSHQSIQGTAKPTRYNVIEDDAKMDINDLQTLTYNLCHLFPRCNRVVSYPAPAYLAHLVAFRGRVYLEGTQRFGDLKKEFDKRIVSPILMQSNPMYFV